MKFTFKKTASVLLLLFGAAIWGVAFVAQSEGSDVVGPFTFVSTRFLLGSAALLPVIGLQSVFTTKTKKQGNPKQLWLGGALCGVALAVASILQQIGIKDNSVGKAGFITALYIIIVPIFGLILGRKVSAPLWVGVGLATVGSYFLCVGEGFTVAKNDWYILACAVCFSVQIMLVDRFVRGQNGLKLACIEFFVCGAVCALPALLLENPTWDIIKSGGTSILYAGLVSSAIGYTLQIICQKNLSAPVASIIMSLESVFAALAGAYFLNETLTDIEILGCVLMFAAIITAQINPKKEK